MRGQRRQSAATPARRCAYEILSQVADGRGYVHDVADRLFVKSDLPRNERAFALLLASGVVSTYGSLDQAIDEVLSNPDDIDFAVRQALHISTYELFFLGKSPHAAVDQGVELVRWVAPKASGVANFALRRLAERAPEWRRRFDEDGWALVREAASIDDPASDEATELIEDVAMRLGFPAWLLRRVAFDHGVAWAVAFASYSNAAAPVFFMVNEAVSSVDEVRATLAEAGVEVSSVAPLSSKEHRISGTFPTFKLVQRGQVGHPAFEGLLDAGAVVVSDAAAQQVVRMALPDECPDRFLEIGSGRGVKTAMLQTAALRRYGCFMELETVEVNERKAERAAKRLGKQGVPVAAWHALDATDLSELGDVVFQAVFVDAPCSGTGTLRRHPEIRWNLQKADVADMSALNLALLKEAASHVAPGGRLTYATCSTLDQENAKVLRRFLASEEGSRFMPLATFFTHLETASADEGQRAADGLRALSAADAPDLHFCCAMARL